VPEFIKTKLEWMLLLLWSDDHTTPTAMLFLAPIKLCRVDWSGGCLGCSKWMCCEGFSCGGSGPGHLATQPSVWVSVDLFDRGRSLAFACTSVGALAVCETVIYSTYRIICPTLCLVYLCDSVCLCACFQFHFSKHM